MMCGKHSSCLGSIPDARKHEGFQETHALGDACNFEESGKDFANKCTHLNIVCWAKVSTEEGAND